MKRYLLIFTICLGSMSMNGQDINLFGRASIHNSGYEKGKIEYVWGVALSADFATPGVSDNDGRYKILFRGIANGTTVDVKAEKEGLEIVNDRDLQNIVLGRKDSLPVYLAPKGVLAKAQTELYNINVVSLTAQYEKDLERLRQNEANFLTELEERFGQKFENLFEAEEVLTQKFESLKKRLPEVAKELARKNLDFAADFYRQAYEAFKRGQLDSVLIILDSEKLDASENIQAIKTLREDKSNIESAISNEEKTIDQKLDGIELKAETYALKINFPLAIETYRQKVQILEEISSSLIDLELAEAYRTLSSYLQENGKYKDALTFIEKCVQIQERVLSPDDLDITTSNNNLAVVYQYLGRYEEAAQLLETALESDRTNLGEQHPTVAIRRSNLAGVYKDLGRYEEAAQLLEAALESDRTNFREQHPNVASKSLQPGFSL